ncbi:hypothetical protein [Kitasatospora sp. NPDC088134]|uniref:hypothetical protein n=1 Tax=Kitasatospora sp. NPDC088134 TaxID=3364071 RepID=UPI0037FDD6D5
MDRATASGRRLRGTRIAAWVLVVGSTVAAAPGCGALGGGRPDEVLIGGSDLAGTWTDKDRNITLRFEPDHRAVVTGRWLSTSCGPQGIWQFYVRDSETSAHTDARATEGYEAAVVLYRPGPPGPSTSCDSLYPSVFRVDGTYALCLIDDPDSFCADSELLYKIPESGDPKIG